MDDPRVGDARSRAARREALDHVLALVANAPCAGSLVLRGSMTMPAWVGDQAREPGDLDWVVRPGAAVPMDDRQPYPYLDRLHPVQVWPEAAHGAARPEIWSFEEFDTGGWHPRLPPEGLRWMTVEETEATDRPHLDVIELVRDQPRTPGGVFLDAEAAVEDGEWSYAYSSSYPYDVEYGSGGVRIVLPWRLPDGPTGSVQLDFAYDEPLPEAPTLIAVPRVDGLPPTPAWAATPELSLAWKLRWLGVDQVTQGRSAAKDLYDAVLLAELDGVRPSPGLLRTVLPPGPDPHVLHPDTIRGWDIDWSDLRSGHPPVRGSTDHWLDRLATALEPLIESSSYRTW